MSWFAWPPLRGPAVATSGRLGHAPSPAGVAAGGALRESPSGVISTPRVRLGPPDILAEMHSGGRRLRPTYGLFSSIALHVAIVGLLSTRSCRSDLPAVMPALRVDLVTVEVASPPRPPQPKTQRPGGGAPALRFNKSPVAP